MERVNRPLQSALRHVPGADRLPGAGWLTAWWQPWTALAAFGFLLHFVWEFLQVPLYRDMASMPHWEGIRTCTVATFGDVLILLPAYAVVALVARDRWWLRRRSAGAMAGFIAAGVVVTVMLEWLNVYVRGRWAYAPAMPLVLGVGLSPLAQWLVVPPVTLWLARRHLGGAPGLSSPTNSETSI